MINVCYFLIYFTYDSVHEGKGWSPWSPLRKYATGTFTNIDDDTSYVRRLRASKNPMQSYTALRKTVRFDLLFKTGLRLRNVVITNRLRSFVRIRWISDVERIISISTLCKDNAVRVRQVFWPYMLQCKLPYHADVSESKENVTTSVVQCIIIDCLCVRREFITTIFATTNPAHTGCSRGFIYSWTLWMTWSRTTFKVPTKTIRLELHKLRKKIKIKKLS